MPAARTVRTRLSPSAETMVPISMLTTIFIRVPAQACGQHTTRMHVRTIADRAVELGQLAHHTELGLQLIKHGCVAATHEDQLAIGSRNLKS